MRHYTFDLKEQKTFSKPFYHTTEIRYMATIRFEDTASFADLVEELEKVKEIFKISQKAIKEGRWFELTITDHVIDKADDWRTVSFDCWVSAPLADQDDNGGVYLRPDTRYTSESRDMYLASSKTLFKDLGFTLR